jgi:DNA-binding response OmpR family regulator
MEPARILLVVADPDMGELYALALTTSLDATTVWVADAASARQRLASDERYDAILLDVGSPPRWSECTDLAACGSGIPVVVVTGWIAGDGRFRRQAFDAGCAAFVLKPCSPASLSEAVRRACSGERRIELLAGARD